MNRAVTRVVLTALLAAGLDAVVAVPAAAQVSPVANGRGCSVVTERDPQAAELDAFVAVVNAGPIAAGDPTATISIRCTMQFGNHNATHAGADAVSVSSAATPGVTAIAPTPASFRRDTSQPVYFCTEVTVGGTTYYRDPWNAADRWSTDSGVECDQAIPACLLYCPDEPGPLEQWRPVFETAGILVGPVLAPLLCPVLGGLAPGAPGLPGALAVTPDGDARVLRTLVWDCPPAAP